MPHSLSLYFIEFFAKISVCVFGGKRCSEKTDYPEYRKKILSSCIAMISDNIQMPTEKQITADCDAFSFVIVADTMEPNIKMAIIRFLYLFGTSLSSISIPSVAVAAGKPDSIFGSSRNKGCQHLESKTIGTKFMSEESLVISTPVKLAIHYTCREPLISKLCNYPQQFPMEISTNIDICFNQNNAANKPSYGVLVDAILDSCFVRGINKYVLHVADIGTRFLIECEDNGVCPIQNMFFEVNKMRDIKGVSVELTQLDIAFNIPTTKKSLIQCFHEKFGVDREQEHHYVTDSMSVDVWPLHAIQIKNEKVDCKQRGSVRLKQKEWRKPKNIKIPLQQEHLIHHEDKSSDSNDDPTFIPSPTQLPNETLLEVYHESRHDNTTPDHFKFDANSIYSVKFYSTISHHLTQCRNQVPLTFQQMNELPLSSMVSLQRFFNHMLKHSGDAMKHVHDHGICARLEVSVRPNGFSSIGNSIRCHGHFIDVLAHVHVALHELFMSGKHKLSVRTSPYQLVYAKVLQLINHVQSLTRFRASVKFCDIHRGNKCSEWLRAIVTVILTYAGLGGETNMKYFAKWLHDESRYNPTNLHPQVLTDLHMNIGIDLSSKKGPLVIHEKFWHVLRKCLHNNQFTDTCISSIISVMKMDKPLSHSRTFLQGTSLHDKFHFAKNIHPNVIPILVAHLTKEDGSMDHSTTTVSTISQYNHWDDRENPQNYIYDPPHTEIYFPQELAFSCLALNQFQDSAVIPKRKQRWHINSPQDPMVMIISKLQDLSLLFDIFTPVFSKYLFQHIKLCHTRGITLPNGMVKLRQLDSNEQCNTRRPNQDEDFHHALQCLKDNRSDRASLLLICKGLDVPIIHDGDDAPSGEILIGSLCRHYFFPCQLMFTFPLDNWHTISLQEQHQMNSLLCETYKTEIVIELKSHLDKKRHFYQFYQDIHIWIETKMYCFQDPRFDISSINEVEKSRDLYVVLDKCFNSCGTLGDEMRMNLYRNLQEIGMEGPLCHHFLNNDASINTHFCLSDTLSELQIQKQFILLESEDTPLGDRTFSNMCPEVILPCVSQLYQSHIFFIDKDSNQSNLFYFDKNSSKVITYTYSNADIFPPPKLKCNVFIKEGSYYKFVELNTKNPFTSLQEQAPNLPYVFHHKQKISSFSNHPWGRIRPADSISSSLRKLLISENVDHEHFRYTHKEEDPLDILDYMNELSTSYLDKTLHYFFSDNIVTQMRNIGIVSLPSLFNRIGETQYTMLPHTIICPILALKYKIWISVWEEAPTNSAKSQKCSFFYYYDSRQDLVVSQVIVGHYTFLPFQSHIFYIKSSKTKKYGYWQQEELNPFKHPEFPYNFANTLPCKFSYLDDPLKTKVIQWFVENLKMKIVYEHDINENNGSNCFLFHDGNIPTLVPIQFLNKEGDLLQHSLLVMYPFDETEIRYSGVIIHSQVSTTLLSQKKAEIIEKLKDDRFTSDYSIEAITIHQKNDFATTFYLMVHMYLAHMSKNVDDLKNNLRKLTQESDLVMKIKIWIVSLISDSIMVRFPKLSIPQWLLQIAYSEETFQDPSQRSKYIRKKPIGHNNELELHRSRNTTKRGESIPALTPILQSAQPSLNASSTSHQLNNKANNRVQTSHRLNNKANNSVQWKISHYSKASILNIFDNPEKFNSEEFQEFITHVGRLANKQTSSLRDPHSQSHSDFCVAVACNQQICAVDLQSLFENNWLSDTIINFMGKVLQRKWQRIHVYSTHFMSTLLSDDTMNSFSYTNVYRWHKNIHAKVQFLYIPIHVNLNHWMLCCLNFSKKEILLWNSSSITSDNSKYLEALKKYVCHVSKSFTASLANKNKKNQWKGTWSMGDKSISSPQQGNLDDCGVFTILNMVLLSSGVALRENSYSQYEINCRKTRERICQIIFQNIHWKDFATDDIKDKQWLMFINRMNESSKNSWSWVNHTTALK